MATKKSLLNTYGGIKTHFKYRNSWGIHEMNLDKVWKIQLEKWTYGFEGFSRKLFTFHTC